MDSKWDYIERTGPMTRKFKTSESEGVVYRAKRVLVERYDNGTWVVLIEGADGKDRTMEFRELQSWMAPKDDDLLPHGEPQKESRALTSAEKLGEAL